MGNTLFIIYLSEIQFYCESYILLVNVSPDKYFTLNSNLVSALKTPTCNTKHRGAWCDIGEAGNSCC